jgi:hypothetical protein
MEYVGTRNNNRYDEDDEINNTNNEQLSVNINQ